MLDLNLPKKNGLFITGTDTGVGKTLVTGGIASILKEQGLKVGVFKPVASGCRNEAGRLISTDAEFLAKCAEMNPPLEIVTPVCYETPAAPITCADLEGRAVNYETIAAAYRHLCQSCDIVLVEGIGGALVPLDERHTILDLAVEFDLPMVIVARAGLGTINHSLLTIASVRNAGLPVAGIVISGYSAAEASIAEQTAPEAICRFSQTNLLAVIPRDEESSVEDGRLGAGVIQSLRTCDWEALSRL